MPIGDNYASVDELKSRVNVPSANTDYDEELQEALYSASREIERFTNRQFNKESSATARLFEPWSRDYIWITDFWTTEGLIIETDTSGNGTFNQTWTTADYELYPRNGQEYGVSGFPYYKIFAVGNQWFPCVFPGERRERLRVTAKWGWQNVPPQVKQATLALSARNFQMKDAPLGMLGGSEWGHARIRDDGFWQSKLQGLRRCGGLRIG